MPIRVLVVDDHSIFRAGVIAELQKATQAHAATELQKTVETIEVVGDAGTVLEALAAIENLRPDVVLLDVHMPDGGGVRVVHETLSSVAIDSAANTPTSSRFLCLSVSDSAEDVIALIRAGARGYVTKSISTLELVDAIARVHSGDAVFSPRLAGYVLDAFTSPTSTHHPLSSHTPTAGTTGTHLNHTAAGGMGVADEARGASGIPETVLEEQDEDREVRLDPTKEMILDELTKREREVLRLLARGYSYREMAQRLFISTKTIETHVSNILRKTQQSNRHALTHWVGSVR